MLTGQMGEMATMEITETMEMTGRTDLTDETDLMETTGMTGQMAGMDLMGRIPHNLIYLIY